MTHERPHTSGGNDVPGTHPRTRRGARTIAASVRRGEGERVVLLLLVALTDALQSLPVADAGDLLALLAGEDADDA